MLTKNTPSDCRVRDLPDGRVATDTKSCDAAPSQFEAETRLRKFGYDKLSKPLSEFFMRTESAFKV